MKLTPKNRKWLYLFLYIVTFFFAYDYFRLIQSGDDSLRRKIVFTIWLVSSIVWLAFFLREIVKNLKSKEKQNK